MLLNNSAFRKIYFSFIFFTACKLTLMANHLLLRCPFYETFNTSEPPFIKNSQFLSFHFAYISDSGNMFCTELAQWYPSTTNFMVLHIRLLSFTLLKKYLKKDLFHSLPKIPYLYLTTTKKTDKERKQIMQKKFYLILKFWDQIWDVHKSPSLNHKLHKLPTDDTMEAPTR